MGTDQSADDDGAYETSILMCGRVDCAAVGVRHSREVLLSRAKRWRHPPHVGLALAWIHSASQLCWVQLLEASSQLEVGSKWQSILHKRTHPLRDVLITTVGQSTKHHPLIFGKIYRGLPWDDGSRLRRAARCQRSQVTHGASAVPCQRGPHLEDNNDGVTYPGMQDGPQNAMLGRRRYLLRECAVTVLPV